MATLTCVECGKPTDPEHSIPITEPDHTTVRLCNACIYSIQSDTELLAHMHGIGHA